MNITIDDDTEYSQGGQGVSQGEMGPQQGEGEGEAQSKGGEMGPGHVQEQRDGSSAEEDSTMVLQDDSEDGEKEKEVEVYIPVWLSIGVWCCVGWHFIGGLMGMFAGCNYKKCCAFMFWMWWIITMTFFVGYDSYLLATITICTAIGICFSPKVKKFYYLLKNNARTPAGYSDIHATAV